MTPGIGATGTAGALWIGRVGMLHGVAIFTGALQRRIAPHLELRQALLIHQGVEREVRAPRPHVALHQALHLRRGQKGTDTAT